MRRAKRIQRDGMDLADDAAPDRVAVTLHDRRVLVVVAGENDPSGSTGAA